MMPATLAIGVLTADVQTRWGTYSAGFEAPVIGWTEDEAILNVGYVPDQEAGRQRNIRIPKALVATGREAEDRTGRCVGCGCEYLRVGAKSSALVCTPCRARGERRRVG